MFRTFFSWERARKRCLTDKEHGKVVVQGPPHTDFPNPEEYPPDRPLRGRCCQDALPNILGRVAQMRCQNVCCQKALGQVDKHGRNRRRGLYVKVSLYLHETRLCCYKTARVPTVAETFGQHPRINRTTIWATPSNNLGNIFLQHPQEIWATMWATPSDKNGQPFWQHTLLFLATPPPFTWATPVSRAAGSYSSGSWWLLFQRFPGGSHSAASLVAQRSKIVPRNCMCFC